MTLLIVVKIPRKYGPADHVSVPFSALSNPAQLAEIIARQLRKMAAQFEMSPPLRGGKGIAQERAIVPTASAADCAPQSLTPPRGAATEAEALRQELQAAREALAAFASEEAELRAVLSPIQAERRDIEDGIRATHGRTPDGALVFDLTKRSRRKPMFNRLDQISAVYGKDFAKARELRGLIGMTERQIEHMARRLKDITTKRTKANG